MFMLFRLTRASGRSLNIRTTRLLICGVLLNLPGLIQAADGDPATLTLTTRLNGEEMQRATTDDLLFSIPQLINYLSTVSELVPGDVIVSGTTGGVGFYRDPQVFMKEGDTVEIELDKIGILRNPIINEK